jgi:hypothetical protein
LASPWPSRVSLIRPTKACSRAVMGPPSTSDGALPGRAHDPEVGEVFQDLRRGLGAPSEVRAGSGGAVKSGQGSRAAHVTAYPLPAASTAGEEAPTFGSPSWAAVPVGTTAGTKTVLSRLEPYALDLADSL